MRQVEQVQRTDGRAQSLLPCLNGGLPGRNSTPKAPPLDLSWMRSILAGQDDRCLGVGWRCLGNGTGVVHLAMVTGSGFES